MELRSVVAAYSLLVFSVTSLLWIFYLSSRPRQPALAWWAGAYSSLTIATFAFALQDRLPRLLYMVLFNGFVHAFFLVLIQGVRVLAGRRSFLGWVGLVGALGLAWNLWFFYVQDSLVARALQYSLFSAGLAAAFAASLLRARFAERSAAVILAALALLVAVLQVLRIVFIVSEGYSLGIIQGMPWDSWIQACVMLLVSLIAIALIYLVALRLSGALAAAARERELLLREMTHRIKNNLALVDGFIALEEGGAGASLAPRFQSLRGRIRCIAASHELLSRHDGLLGRVELAEYFAVVARGLQVPLSIELEEDFEPLELPLSTAQSLGIALNELATNALKYAFVGRAQGRLRLSFSVQAGRGRLGVADDGIGGAWPPAKPGLGSQILEELARSLRGRLEVDTSSGSTFVLDFPLPEGS